MSLTSFGFLCFFLVFFILYWKSRASLRWILLLIASFYFYLSSKPIFALLLLGNTVISYCSALWLEKMTRRRAPLFAITIIVLLIPLVFFKYFNLISISTNEIISTLGIHLTLPQFELLLPLGISFFTFQSLGYVFDVYRKKTKAETNFGVLALFVSFFPTISAGPIERFAHLRPQLLKPKPFSYPMVTAGMKLFTWGLFKKLVVADNLAIVVEKVFSNLHDFRGFSLLLALFFFSIQIFADFSGYTDVARGVGKMLGIDLLPNFNLPYFSTSIRDFWRRWHMSLSYWLRDYLYIPLGGSRKGSLRTYVNTIIVFVVCGIWHGAGWGFVLWGLLNGIIIGFERFVSLHVPTQLQKKIPRLVSILYSFSTVTLLWIFFRSKTLDDSLFILRNAFVGIQNIIHPSYLWASVSQLFHTNIVEMVIAGFAVLSILISEIIAARIGLSNAVSRQPKLIRWSVYMLLLVSILTLRNSTVVQFIYVQF